MSIHMPTSEEIAEYEAAESPHARLFVPPDVFPHGVPGQPLAGVGIVTASAPPPPSNVPARHRAVLVSERGAPEYVDLGPAEPAPEVLTRDGVRWAYAGCSDGVAVYGDPRMA